MKPRACDVICWLLYWFGSINGSKMFVGTGASGWCSVLITILFSSERKNYWLDFYKFNRTFDIGIVPHKDLEKQWRQYQFWLLLLQLTENLNNRAENYGRFARHSPLRDISATCEILIMITFNCSWKDHDDRGCRLRVNSPSNIVSYSLAAFANFFL